jgi:hypothetical protein
VDVIAGGAATSASIGGVASVSGAMVIGRSIAGDGAIGIVATGTAACTRSFAHPAAPIAKAQATTSIDI